MELEPDPAEVVGFLAEALFPPLVGLGAAVVAAVVTAAVFIQSLSTGHRHRRLETVMLSQTLPLGWVIDIDAPSVLASESCI